MEGVDDDFSTLCENVRKYAKFIFECPSCGCPYIAFKDLGSCPACCPPGFQKEPAEMLNERDA